MQCVYDKLLGMFRVRWLTFTLTHSGTPQLCSHEEFFHTKEAASKFIAQKKAAISELMLEKVLRASLEEITARDSTGRTSPRPSNYGRNKDVGGEEP